MRNSSLISYTHLSPWCDRPRTDKIRKITVHHMAGNLTVETCGRVFDGSREVSSNYGIGSDGRIALYVDEANRSWCSSSGSNDHQAITIEVANDGGAPNWHVSDKALASLLALCIDICKRNGIARINYTGDASGNLTRHNMFASTACPGPYLQSKLPWLAEEINKALQSGASGNAAQPTPAPSVPSGGVLYRVQVGAYKSQANAERMAERLKALSYQTYLLQAGGLYKVQTGAFAKRDNAEKLAAELREAGFPVYTTTNGGAAVTSTPAAAPAIAEGDRVRVKAGAKDWDGGGLASWVYSTVYTVLELSGRRAVIGIDGAVTAAIDVGQLTKA